MNIESSDIAWLLKNSVSQQEDDVWLKRYILSLYSASNTPKIIIFMIPVNLFYLPMYREGAYDNRHAFLCGHIA